MPTFVMVNESVESRRSAFFQVVGTDGITPATGEAGGQPQVTKNNSGSWSDSGIGVLVAIGNGRYYAVLDQGFVDTIGDRIETRYKSNATAEAIGDSFQVVAYDPYSTDIGGDGSQRFVIVIQDTAGRPIEQVRVWVTSSEDVNAVVAGTLQTDSDGEVAFMLNPGSYFAWRHHPKYNFTNPQAFRVS